MYNRLRRVDDAPGRSERPHKYMWVEHVARQSIYAAARAGVPLYVESEWSPNSVFTPTAADRLLAPLTPIAQVVCPGYAVMFSALLHLQVLF